MGWQDDPRVQKLLDKATIESLLKTIFGEIYGPNEVQNMENGLKRALTKYDRKKELQEKLSENRENEAEPLLKECLVVICNKNLHQGRSHTSKTLLLLAKFFTKLGDYRIASELLWGFASLLISEFVKKHSLRVDLDSHVAKRRFAWALTEDIGTSFSVFETCHRSFYTNENNASDLSYILKHADQFIHKLEALDLSEDKKKELEKRDFY